MKTRCKFQVSEVTKFSCPGERVKLFAVYGGSQENESFAAATPSGEISIYVNNPAVIGKFQPGQYYYVDLTPAEQ